MFDIEHFKERKNPFFFVKADEFRELREEIWAVYPKEAKEQIAIADKTVAGFLPAQGHWVLALGGGATGEYHRFTEDFDWNRWGHKENTWSLNKLYFVEDLAKAYLLTGDNKYPKTFFQIWNQWQANNPRPDHFQRVRPKEVFSWGTSWRSLCMSMRIWSLLWAYHYFLPTMSNDELSSLINSLHEHGEYLAWINSEDYFPGNWQIEESNCLASLAIMFPEFKESEEWLDLAWKRLDEHLEKDVYPDGVHLERNFGYHTTILEPSWKSILLAKVNDRKIDFLKRRWPFFEKMWEFILYAVTPTGICPLIKHNRPKNYRAILSIAALLFDRGDFKYVGEQRLSYEAIWFFGKHGSKQYEDMLKREPKKCSIRFPDGGYVFIRSSWTKDSQYLVFTNDGPYKGGHDHADKMSFELWAYGEPLIREAGSIDYDDPRSQTWFDQTRSHNTVMLDGRDQFNRIPTEHGPHIKYDIRGLTEFVQRPPCQYLRSRTDAYKDFGVTHLRRILFVEREYFLVTDFLTGQEERWVSEAQLHFPGEIAVEGDTVIESHNGVGLLVISCLNNAKIFQYRGEMKTLDLDTSMGIINAPYITLAQKANLPHKYCVLLYPYSKERPALSIRKLLDEPRRFAIEIENKKENTKDIYFETLYKKDKLKLEGVNLLGPVTWMRLKGKQTIFHL